jgi:hypothetical protein
MGHFNTYFMKYIYLAFTYFIMQNSNVLQCFTMPV